VAFTAYINLNETAYLSVSSVSSTATPTQPSGKCGTGFFASLSYIAIVTE